MKLRDYIAPLDLEARERLAQDCQTTVKHLFNVMYGYRACAPALAADIERVTAGAVSRPELRPSDWRRIWPELAANDQAREVVNG